MRLLAVFSPFAYHPRCSGCHRLFKRTWAGTSARHNRADEILFDLRDCLHDYKYRFSDMALFYQASQDKYISKQALFLVGISYKFCTNSLVDDGGIRSNTILWPRTSAVEVNGRPDARGFTNNMLCAWLTAETKDENGQNRKTERSQLRRRH